MTVKPKTAGSSTWTGLLAAGAVVLGVVAVPGAAQAQSNTAGFFNSLFGGGSDEAAINYSERPSLVLPPKRDVLPSPGQAASYDTDPNWPKDPDEIKRRNKQAELTGNMPASQTGTAPTAHTPVINDPPTVQAMDEMIRRNKRSYDASDMDRIRNAFRGTHGEDDPVVFGKEPVRASLIDPPSGLRVPSAKATLDADAKLPSELEAEQKKNWFQKLF